MADAFGSRQGQSIARLTVLRPQGGWNKRQVPAETPAGARSLQSANRHFLRMSHGRSSKLSRRSWPRLRRHPSVHDRCLWSVRLLPQQLSGSVPRPSEPELCICVVSMREG